MDDNVIIMYVLCMYAQGVARLQYQIYNVIINVLNESISKCKIKST